MAANVPEYSVSEISGAIKRTVEDAFGYVRVRGELGRVSRSGNGHCYLDLKDERSVLSSVIWKGTAARLSIRPEQGMEVIATGRLTTFAGQSRYQLVIDQLEPAGAGALMALLEDRKKRLSAEGLFAAERKKPLPYLPDVIGVVTSPTGAVIRDILHRLRDRYPSHVIVWPTAVQGEQAAPQIVAGIDGFNRLSPEDGIRPDVMIVARGGGSLEDLWCFNDEAVARAVAASVIPVISAVGHETDTTLIDYVADVRAPTPTAAAEMAVPVRLDLLQDVTGQGARLSQAVLRREESARLAMTAAVRGLGRPEQVLGPAEQRLDKAADGLVGALRGRLDQARSRSARAFGGFSRGRLVALADEAGRNLDRTAARLRPTMERLSMRLSRELGRLKLPLATVQERIAARDRDVAASAGRLDRAGRLLVQAAQDRLSDRARFLDSLSYRSVLHRGYAVVRHRDGTVVPRRKGLSSGMAVEILFADGPVDAAISGQTANPATGREKQLAAKGRRGDRAAAVPPPQATLFEDE